VFMKRKAFALTIVLALLIPLIVMVQPAKSSPETITVPDDYSTIQEAINNANAGDTVFVRNGTYFIAPPNRIVIDKPLSLIGENPNTVVLADTEKHQGSGRWTVSVTSDDVTISGFTIKNCASGIGTDSHRCRIIGNNIINNYNGLAMGGDKHVISENNITGNSYGIGATCPNSIISGNNISHNSIGTIIDDCKNLTIIGNSFTHNGHIGRFDEVTDLNGSLFLRWEGPFYVYGNIITDNEGYGIMFGEGCSNSRVYGNNITGNSIGVELLNFVTGEGLNKVGSGNILWGNNFDNLQQVLVEKEYMYAGNFGDHEWGTNGTDVVSWDNCTEGNYWSDYEGSGFYMVDNENVDHYPLIQPVDISAVSPPTNQGQEPFPTIIVIASIVSVAVVGVGLLVYFKKRKH
jgi:nitrous oxidase accessory protein